MLTNRKPMNRRSGFASQWQPKPKEERVAAILKPIRQGVTHGAATLPLEASPKFQYVRSPKLLRVCGELSCQVCDSEIGSVGAHSNWAIHGKGKSIKASDQYIAAMCYLCHGELDQGSESTEDERKQTWFKAHVKTVQKLVILKLWPHDVQIPNLEWPESW